MSVSSAAFATAYEPPRGAGGQRERRRDGHHPAPAALGHAGHDGLGHVERRPEVLVQHPAHLVVIEVHHRRPAGPAADDVQPDSRSARTGSRPPPPRRARLPDPSGRRPRPPIDRPAMPTFGRDLREPVRSVPTSPSRAPPAAKSGRRHATEAAGRAGDEDDQVGRCVRCHDWSIAHGRPIGSLAYSDGMTDQPARDLARLAERYWQAHPGLRADLRHVPRRAPVRRSARRPFRGRHRAPREPPRRYRKRSLGDRHRPRGRPG